MALDHAAHVSRVAVLNSVPTVEMYERADREFGFGHWHWFFLPQPAPYPETLIGHAPDALFEGSLMKLTTFHPGAFDAYRASWRRPATIQAMCEDYRAGFGIDRRPRRPRGGTKDLRASACAMGHPQRDRKVVRPVDVVAILD